MFSAQTVADYIKRLHQSRATGVAAYWVEEIHSRSDVVRDMSALTSELPILTVAVRRDEFDDPNGIIDDLSRTISDNIEWFNDANRTAVVRDLKFSLVLVSKRPLGVPQLSSPVVLPDWFPLWPNRLLTVNIKSIAHSIDISLASADVPITPINSALFELETAICNRLELVARQNPSAASRLLARIDGGRGLVNLDALIANAKGARNGVDPSGFRPGGGAESPFLVSQLFRQWWECSHNGMHELAVQMAEALCISANMNIEPQYSLATLLTRTVKPPLSKTPPGVTFSRNALVSLSHAIQFTNAVHHAADYPNFPAQLVIAYARDLATSCKCAARELEPLARAGGAQASPS